MRGLKVGFEMECIYNLDIIKNDGYISSYHNGHYGNFFKKLRFLKAENDNSIKNDKRYFKSMGRPCEFIFNALDMPTKKIFNKNIELFIKVFSDNGKYELNKVLKFNKSMGCHFNFSYKNKSPLDLKTHPIYLKFMREYFFKKLKDLKINALAKKGIFEHYNRYYAQQDTLLNNNSICRLTRFTEFNINNFNRVEWRAANLIYIKTWKELKTILNLYYDSIDFLITRSNLKDIKFKIRVKKEDIKQTITELNNLKYEKCIIGDV